MSRKTYKLSDIEKILTYVPPAFIGLLMVLSLIILFLVTQYKVHSEAQLYTQQQKYIEENHLNSYLNAVEQQVKSNLSKVEENLKRSVHILKGISMGLEDSKRRREKLIRYIKELESKGDMQFLLFDNALNILHGQKVARSIRTLIFGSKRGKRHLDITLMYMKSQGDDSAMSWKNDLTKTIQLSYFAIDEQAGIYIGAFSSVDYLQNLTATASLNAITKGDYRPKGYYFWLHQKELDKVYNLDNQKRWQTDDTIPSDSIVTEVSKYGITIGIAHTEGARSGQYAQKMSEIQNRLNQQRNTIALVIVLATIVLLAFTVLFSDYIKKIFAEFNRKEERKNRQIKSLKERYELAVIASNDGLWDTNFQTKRTFFSKKWLDMLGYERADVKSYDDWLSIIHPEDVHRVIEDIRAHTSEKDKEHLVCEYRLRKKNGDYIWVLGRGKAFVDKDGNPIRLSMMSMDIDEKKQADKKLKALVEKELAKNERKRRMLIQQNKMAAMGEMIGAIAHQWRQPLNNISLILHFIRDNAKDKVFVEEKMDDFVNRAKAQIEYMSNTIDDFRDFYRIDKIKEFFSVKEAIKITTEIEKAHLKNHAIEIRITGDDMHILGYKSEFEHVILNLINNAADTINQRGVLYGKIEIILTKGMITVKDNAGGIDDAIKDRIFEPYFTTKEQGEGTGIGLYMAKVIIEKNMGGRLCVRNGSKGAEFTIIFPDTLEKSIDMVAEAQMC